MVRGPSILFPENPWGHGHSMAGAARTLRLAPSGNCSSSVASCWAAAPAEAVEAVFMALEPANPPVQLGLFCGFGLV